MAQQIYITAEALGGTRSTHARWVYLLLRELLSDAVAEAEILYGAFSDGAWIHADLVIGFELSEISKKRLAAESKRFIDLRIHPVRFLDDIFFSFETNEPHVYQKLEGYRVDDALCRLHADHIAATVVKLKKAELVLPNSLLLIGQTEADRVIYDGERYLTLADRLEQIAVLAETHDHIYFKPHPYAKNSRHLFKQMKKTFGNVRYTGANVYHLLGNSGVAHVAALNSSVLHEAEYFGKQTTFLFSRTFGEQHIGVYNVFLSGAFWSDILSPILETAPSELQRAPQPSRLRKTLNDFWGYNAIADDIVLRDIVKEKIRQLLNRVR